MLLAGKPAVRALPRCHPRPAWAGLSGIFLRYQARNNTRFKHAGVTKPVLGQPKSMRVFFVQTLIRYIRKVLARNILYDLPNQKDKTTEQDSKTWSTEAKTICVCVTKVSTLPISCKFTNKSIEAAGVLFQYPFLLDIVLIRCNKSVILKMLIHNLEIMNHPFRQELF